VSSFLQHNLRLVVWGICPLVVVMKFQDKLANLWQLNSPNSQDKFKICCIDMYLLRFLVNFAVFCTFCEFFCRISLIYLNFTAPRPRKISEALAMGLCEVHAGSSAIKLWYNMCGYCYRCPKITCSFDKLLLGVCSFEMIHIRISNPRSLGSW